VIDTFRLYPTLKRNKRARKFTPERIRRIGACKRKEVKRTFVLQRQFFKPQTKEFKNFILLGFIQYCALPNNSLAKKQFAKETQKQTPKMKYYVIFAFFLYTVICQNSAKGLSCSECNHPKFQKQPLYLPFCLNEKTYSNLCEALCSISEEDRNLESQRPTKGSCEKCEIKCSKIFIPTCSRVSGSEVSTVFPNKCHAKCSGKEFENCKNLPNSPVIPGKTKLPALPISKESPEGLQNLENFWTH